MKRTGHRGVRNKTQENKGLDRYLSRLDVWAMAFGCMVGWGAFVMPGTTFLPAAGPAGTVIALAAYIPIPKTPSAGITPSWPPGFCAFPA